MQATRTLWPLGSPDPRSPDPLLTLAAAAAGVSLIQFLSLSGARVGHHGTLQPILPEELANKGVVGAACSPACLCHANGACSEGVGVHSSYWCGPCGVWLLAAELDSPILR